MATRDDFLSARQTAYDCAGLAGQFVHWSVGPLPTVPDGVKCLLDRFSAQFAPCDTDWPWNVSIPPGTHLYMEHPPTQEEQQRIDFMAQGFWSLCDALDAGRAKIAAVEPLLLEARLEFDRTPVTCAGMSRTTTHQLAWDLAKRLWLSVRETVWNHWVQRTTHKWPGKPPSFQIDPFREGQPLRRGKPRERCLRLLSDLRDQIILGSWRDVQKALTPYATVDFAELEAAILIEAAAALAKFCGDSEDDRLAETERDEPSKVKRQKVTQGGPRYENWALGFDGVSQSWQLFKRQRGKWLHCKQVQGIREKRQSRLMKGLLEGGGFLAKADMLRAEVAFTAHGQGGKVMDRISPELSKLGNTIREAIGASGAKEHPFPFVPERDGWMARIEIGAAENGDDGWRFTSCTELNRHGGEQ